jgi:hypothetical protein
MQTLAETQSWLQAALTELKRERATATDPRWQTYNEVKQQAERLEEEILELEKQQEKELTETLTRTGALTLELEDGSHRTVSAQARTAGGGESLLPADLLRVWRVVQVFQGTILLGGEVTSLRFGDKQAVATIAHLQREKKKEKAAKKGAVVGEEASLFGEEASLFGRD